MVNIYKLIHPETLEVRYVGKTVESLKRRLSKHINNRMNNSKVNKWIRKLIRNKQYPIIELIEQTTDDVWIEREMYWIDYYRQKNCNLMNITPGGECGSLNYTHTNEAKNKIGLANSRPKSKEWITNAKEATRRATSIPIIQYSLLGEKIKEWDSFCFAAEEINPLNYTAAIKNIHACCNGKRNTAYKFKWKYKV